MTGTFPRIESREFRGMGTDIGLLLVVRNEEEVTRAIVDIIIARSEYARYEKIFSRFDLTSELSSLNTSLGKLIKVSSEMLEVAGKALVYYTEHDELYDPRIITVLEASGYARDFQKKDFTPQGTLASFDVSRTLEQDLIISDDTVTFFCRMDFAGIVKGYVTDKITTFLKTKGWTNFLVDSGGDMYASGRPHDASAWNIIVEGLNDGNMVFPLSNNAIATSGISRRKWEHGGKHFHHLIHPKHPEQFSFDVKTLTVVASSTEEADVLAKTLFIRDDTDRKTFATEHNIAVLILYSDQTTWISPTAQKYLLK